MKYYILKVENGTSTFLTKNGFWQGSRFAQSFGKSTAETVKILLEDNVKYINAAIEIIEASTIKN